MNMMLFIFLPAVLALVVSLYVLIGVFVYRDAKRRGMNAALWTAVAVLVPSLIGVIIYLLARNNAPEGNLCSQCGAPVSEGFAACPKCGSELAAPCPGCARQVSREWRVCPYCKAELPAPRQVYKAPAGKTSPALIVAIVALVVLVFTGLALGLIYFPLSGLGSHSSGVQIGMVENSTHTDFSGSFSYSDGTKSKPIRLEQGQTLTLKADILEESGNISVEIDDPSGRQLQTIDGSFNDVITVKADEAGDYVVKVTMEKCKGHYKFSWTID